MPPPTTITSQVFTRIIVKDLAHSQCEATSHVTRSLLLLKMGSMKSFLLGAIVLVIVAAAPFSRAQKDKDNEPTTWIYFTVVKDDNGKPVRNAAVIMHPVNEKGRQERGGLELKTDPDGKANFDGVPYGPLRVQVLARGFQTFGEDYTIERDKTEITVKLKRPQGQFSIYDDPAGGPQQKQDPKQENPPAESKKPN